MNLHTSQPCRNPVFLNLLNSLICQIFKKRIVTDYWQWICTNDGRYQINTSHVTLLVSHGQFSVSMSAHWLTYVCTHTHAVIPLSATTNIFTLCQLFCTAFITRLLFCSHHRLGQVPDVRALFLRTFCDCWSMVFCTLDYSSQHSTNSVKALKAKKCALMYINIIIIIMLFI